MAQAMHRSTSRVLDIFQLLSNTSEGHTLTEISQALESPKSSILPILQTLTDRGYIELDYHTNRYTIGMSLYLAGTIYRNKISANQFIDREMNFISSHIKESCCLAILEGTQTLFLHRTDAADPVFCHKSPGKRELACLGAMGKALLCDYKLDELSDLFLKNGGRLPPDLNLYRAHIQMEETRFTRLSYEYGDVEHGIQCVASPIRVNERVVAALGVILPSFRATPTKAMDASQYLQISTQKIENVLSSIENLHDVLSLDGFKNL